MQACIICHGNVDPNQSHLQQFTAEAIDIVMSEQLSLNLLISSRLHAAVYTQLAQCPQLMIVA